MYHVTFNGLENVAFEFSPVAFTVFGKEIYWYGVVITIGIILSALYAFWRAKKLGIRLDDMYDYAIFIIIFGVIGARAYYVLTTLNSMQYKTFTDVIAIWNGGLAIYGGIIAGILVVIIVSKVKKIKILRVLDAIAPAVMIGQALGRWGNYFNQEAFGCNTTLPWGMKSYVVQSTGTGRSIEGTVEYLTKNKASIEAQGMTVDPQGFVHPTFLYECLWNIIGFIIINIFFRKRKYNGQMFLMYITWYGLGRAFIEMLRTDSLYIPGTPVRISMLVGFLCFAGGVAAMIVLGIRAKKNPQEVTEGAYYGKFSYKNEPEIKKNKKNKNNKEETPDDTETKAEDGETVAEETVVENEDGATVVEETVVEAEDGTTVVEETVIKSEDGETVVEETFIETGDGATVTEEAEEITEEAKTAAEEAADGENKNGEDN